MLGFRYFIPTCSTDSEHLTPYKSRYLLSVKVSFFIIHPYSQEYTTKCNQSFKPKLNKTKRICSLGCVGTYHKSSKNTMRTREEFFFVVVLFSTFSNCRTIRKLITLQAVFSSVVFFYFLNGFLDLRCALN